MDRDEANNRLLEARVIAVLRAGDVETARSLMHAYTSAGVRAIELTTTIRNWETLLRIAINERGVNTLIGLGTLTDPDDVTKAADIGADFVVSPYLSLGVIEAAEVEGLTVIPGALTPSEIAQAYDMGAELVKVFPVSQVGGPNYIKALLAPMPGWKLVPTGGVTPDNAIDFLRAGAVAVGIGSNLAPKDKVAERDWEGVAIAVRAFLDDLDRQLKESGS